MDKREFLLLLDELLEADPGTVGESTSLKGLEGWDSLAVVGFIAMVDEQFDVTLNPKAIAECKQVGDLIGLLDSRIAA